MIHDPVMHDLGCWENGNRRRNHATTLSNHQLGTSARQFSHRECELPEKESRLAIWGGGSGDWGGWTKQSASPPGLPVGHSIRPNGARHRERTKEEGRGTGQE